MTPLLAGVHTLDPRGLPAFRALMLRWYRRNPLTATEQRSGESYCRAIWRRALFADPCPYCGGAVENVDHVWPVALGGGNHWTNITGACVACNSEKGATPLLHWLIRRAEARELASRLGAIKTSRSAPARFGLFAERLTAALARPA